MNYLLKNAVLVNEGRCRNGEIRIKDGKIESVCWETAAGEDESVGICAAGRGAAEGAERESDVVAGMDSTAQAETFPGPYQEIDLKGAYVLPGIIDDQVHFRQPGLTHKGDIASESLAALKGGVTSFMDMPNTKPQTLTQELLVQNPAYLEALFANAPTIVAAHCEEESVIRQNTADFKARYGEEAPFSIHPLVRSAEACYQSSSKAAALARKHGAKLHILHLSTAKELELLGDDGISGEICVHYLWFSDQDYGKYGWRMKCNPAIKTAEDREALRRAVKSGQLVVATDHAPHTYEEKQKPYFECPSGSPWVGHSLPMMLELVHQGVFSLTEVVEAMCHRPARLFQIAGRGFLRPGYAADLAVVDPGQAWQVDKSNIDYKCGWSALEGQVLHGKVLSTFVNGHLVYDKGEVLMPDYRGERLLFDR